MRLFLQLDSEMLTDYIRYIFNGDGTSPLKISSSHEFGELLIAHARTSDRPVPRPDGNHVIEIKLPMSNTTQSLANRFLYYSKADMKRLNMGLHAIFNIDFQQYYLKGLELEFTKKDIITAFITSRKLFSADVYDAIHKRAYRREIAKQQKLTRKLLRKAYYIDESINTTGLNTENHD